MFVFSTVGTATAAPLPETDTADTGSVVLDSDLWLAVTNHLSTLSPASIVDSPTHTGTCEIPDPNTLACRDLSISPPHPPETATSTNRTAADEQDRKPATQLRSDKLRATPTTRSARNFILHFKRPQPDALDVWRARELTWDDSTGLHASDVFIRHSVPNTELSLAIQVDRAQVTRSTIILDDIEWRRRQKGDGAQFHPVGRAKLAVWRHAGSEDGPASTDGEWQVTGRRAVINRDLWLPIGLGTSKPNSDIGFLPPTVSANRPGADARSLVAFGSANLLAGPVLHAFGPDAGVGAGIAVGIAAPHSDGWPLSGPRSADVDQSWNPLTVEIVAPPGGDSPEAVASGEWTTEGQHGLSTSGQLEEYTRGRLWTPYHHGEDGAFRAWRTSTAGLSHTGRRHEVAFAAASTQTGEIPRSRHWNLQFISSGELPVDNPFRGDASIAYVGLHSPNDDVRVDRHTFVADTRVKWQTDRSAPTDFGLDGQLLSGISLKPEATTASTTGGTRTVSHTMAVTGANAGVSATGRFDDALHRVRASLSAQLPTVVIESDDDNGNNVADRTGSPPYGPVASGVADFPQARAGEGAATAMIDQSLSLSTAKLRLPVGAVGAVDRETSQLRVAPFGLVSVDTQRWRFSAAAVQPPDGPHSMGGESRYHFPTGFIGYAYTIGGRAIPWVFDLAYAGTRPARRLTASHMLTTRTPRPSGGRTTAIHRLDAGVEIRNWHASMQLTASSDESATPGVSLQITHRLSSLGWAVGVTGMAGGPTQQLGGILGLMSSR